MTSICDICGKEASCSTHGMHLCHKHRSQWYRRHKFDDQTIFAENDYILHDDYAEIVLRNSKSEDVGHALIDLEDVPKCKQYKWHMRKPKYVIATIPNGTKSSNEKVHLHRMIAECDDPAMEVDHINRNPLDNRKANLRIVNRQTNATNNAGTGVILVPSGRYQARVMRHYKQIYIGTFDTYEEAVAARKEFVEKYDAEDPTRICKNVGAA